MGEGTERRLREVLARLYINGHIHIQNSYTHCVVHIYTAMRLVDNKANFEIDTLADHEQANLISTLLILAVKLN